MLSAPVAAHDVEAKHTVSRDGTAIRIEFFFHDGKPAADFAVTTKYENGPESDIGKTDDKGVFVLHPTHRSACEITVRQAGHGEDITLPLAVIGPVYDASHGHSHSAHGHSHSAAPPPAEEEAFGPSKRGATPFPLTEALASVAFVALLSIVTLILMRVAGRQSGRAADDREVILRELADLRAEVQRLREEADKS